MDNNTVIDKAKIRKMFSICNGIIKWSGIAANISRGKPAYPYISPNGRVHFRCKYGYIKIESICDAFGLNSSEKRDIIKNIILIGKSKITEEKEKNRKMALEKRRRIKSEKEEGRYRIKWEKIQTPTGFICKAIRANVVYV